MSIILISLMLCINLILYFKAKISDAVVLSVFSMLLITFILLVFGCDYTCISAVFCVGIIVNVISIIYGLKKSIQVKGNILSVFNDGCIYFVFLFIIFVLGVIIFSHYRTLSDGEFQYYVISAKQIFMTDSFGAGENVVYGGYGSYTPIQGVFLYLVMKSIGEWKENVIYISNFIICELLVTPLIFENILSSKVSIIIRGVLHI